MTGCVITIDVEPDCTPTWHYSNPLSFEGVARGIVRILQPLFREYGAVPTYLVNNVVLEDERSVDLLGTLEGRCELGAHLHPEFIEPGKVFSSYAGRKAEMNLNTLSELDQYEKTRSITELFAARFHAPPVSFRAGRFSANAGTIRSLLKLGYRVDTSVTPHVRWDDPTREIPVDFRHAPTQPYFVSPRDILVPEVGGGILEVPVSIAPVRRLFRTRLSWLRPHLSSAAEMLRVVRATRRGVPKETDVILNVMFHNVEVLPRLSPYCQTPGECRRYLNSLRVLFETLARDGVEFLCLKDLYARRAYPEARHGDHAEY
jgi:hypothetical protein